MSDPPRCPECGRRPSEARDPVLLEMDNRCIYAPVRCPDPVHDIADAGPEAVALLRRIEGIMNESRGVDGWHLNGAPANWDEFDEVADLGALLARLPGSGEPS